MTGKIKVLFNWKETEKKTLTAGDPQIYTVIKQ